MSETSEAGSATSSREATALSAALKIHSALMDLAANSSAESPFDFLDGISDDDAEDIIAASFLEEEDDIEEGEDIGDPCHEFEHSILFYLLLIASASLVGLYCYLLAKRRLMLYGYDILQLLLLCFAAIRFGPKLWGSLQVHGLHHASQSGCKLIAYTEFGLRHVNVFLVGCLLAYAWFAVIRGRDDVDKLIRRHFAWLLLFLFALQGVTGMVPAIYTDVDYSGTRCDFARTEEMSLSQFLAGQVILSTLLPYILPFLAMAYPLFLISKKVANMDRDEPGRFIARNIAVIAWSHILLSFPWAMHALVMLPLMQGWTVGLDGVTVCIVDGIFRLLLESWYVVVPATCILGDPTLCKDLPGSETFWSVVDKGRVAVVTPVMGWRRQRR